MKHLEEMQENDIDDVVAVIESHDEDDADEAAAGFRSIGGCMDMYVLRHEGKVIGVTGFSTPPGCDQTHWLSWTYVHDDYTNQGFGRKMLIELIDHLKKQQGRMLFVKVSDYIDEDAANEEDGAIYAAALHLYQSLGFKIELTHPDYYDEGESQICLGLRLSDTPAMIADIDIAKEDIGVQFNAVFEIPETDDAYTFGWDNEGEQVFSQEDVTIGLDNVREQEGRIVFISFPSNYNGIKEPLLAAGFKESGKLHNYYEDGIHDQHYTYKL